MSGVLVDSSVLADVVTHDARQQSVAERAIIRAGRHRELVINAIIFAEVSIPFERIEELDDRLKGLFQVEEVPLEAAFLAGKAFLNYRKRGGSRRSPLPDFFIGAHAAVRGHALLTRERGGFRSYFPTVEILTPAELTA
jgi:predicted nucleic acid-binding protein